MTPDDLLHLAWAAFACVAIVGVFVLIGWFRLCEYWEAEHKREVAFARERHKDDVDLELLRIGDGVPKYSFHLNAPNLTTLPGMTSAAGKLTEGLPQ